MARRADFEPGMDCNSSCVLRVNGHAVHPERRDDAIGPASRGPVLAGGGAMPS